MIMLAERDTSDICDLCECYCILHSSLFPYSTDVSLFVKAFFIFSFGLLIKTKNLSL